MNQRERDRDRKTERETERDRETDRETERQGEFFPLICVSCMLRMALAVYVCLQFDDLASKMHNPSRLQPGTDRRPPEHCKNQNIIKTGSKGSGTV